MERGLWVLHNKNMSDEYDNNVILEDQERPRRRTTNEYYESFKKEHQSPLWKAIVLGAAIAACSGIVTWVGKSSWEGVRSSIVNGKADSTVVEVIKQDNDAAHEKINAKLEEVEKKQEKTHKISRKIAKKLKIEIGDND